VDETPREHSKLQEFFLKHRASSAAGGMVALGIAVLLYRGARPSNDRDWVPEQSRLAFADIRGDKVAIRGVRCFDWSVEGPPRERYETRSYDLRRLSSLDFTVSRFGMRGLAGHTLLSFGFDDGRYLAVSVEVRRSRGQHYSFVRGLFRHYELMYVIADERDVLHLRTNIRDESTYLFPVNVPVEKLRPLLVSVLERANRLAENPEFYHSVLNSCTTNLMAHLNEAGVCRAAEHGPRAVFSGLADSLFFDLGLIGNGGSLRELRRRHRITERGQAYGDGEGFSEAIRRV